MSLIKSCFKSVFSYYKSLFMLQASNLASLFLSVIYVPALKQEKIAVKYLPAVVPILSVCLIGWTGRWIIRSYYPSARPIDQIVYLSDRTSESIY